MAVNDSAGHVRENRFFRLLAVIGAIDEAAARGLRAPGRGLLLSHAAANLPMALVLAIVVVKHLVGPRLLL